MLHESTEKAKIQINDAAITFDDVYKNSNLSSELLEEIKKADILILPYLDFRGYKNCLFPEQTYQFYTHLKKEAKKQNLSADIAISDEDYKEIELHADVVNIADVLIQWALFPVLTGMISSFLYDLVRKRKQKMNAYVKISVEKNGKAKTIHFEGDIENFERAMKSIDETIFK